MSDQPGAKDHQYEHLTLEEQQLQGDSRINGSVSDKSAPNPSSLPNRYSLPLVSQHRSQPQHYPYDPEMLSAQAHVQAMANLPPFSGFNQQPPPFHPQQQLYPGAPSMMQPAMHSPMAASFMPSNFSSASPYTTSSPSSSPELMQSFSKPVYPFGGQPLGSYAGMPMQQQQLPPPPTSHHHHYFTDPGTSSNIYQPLSHPAMYSHVVQPPIYEPLITSTYPSNPHSHYHQQQHQQQNPLPAVPPSLMASGQYQKLPKKSFKRIPIDFLLNQEISTQGEVPHEILNDLGMNMIIRSKDNTPRKNGTPKANVGNTAAVETTAAAAIATAKLQAVTDSNAPTIRVQLPSDPVLPNPAQTLQQPLAMTYAAGSGPLGASGTGIVIGTGTGTAAAASSSSGPAFGGAHASSSGAAPYTSLSPFDSSNRKRWTPEDDSTLMDVVKKHGAKDWNFVASFFPGRNADNVRLRYKYFLQFPEHVREKPFTEEEDKMIMEESVAGRRWARIGKLTGRSSSAIKNRYYVLQRLAVRQVYEQKQREELERKDPAGSDGGAGAGTSNNQL